MGRLADQWAQRRITMRIPFVFAGELIQAASITGVQFPDATFMNNIDKPYEIHRMKPWVSPLDTNGVLLANATTFDEDTLQNIVRLTIADLGKNEKLTKSATLIVMLVKGSSERTWEFADPYYLVRSELIQVIVDTLAFPTAISGLTNLRIQVSFQGFLVVVAPPSESR